MVLLNYVTNRISIVDTAHTGNEKYKAVA